MARPRKGAEETSGVEIDAAVVWGLCHRTWDRIKELLQVRHGIEWRSLREMNPWVVFDCGTEAEPLPGVHARDTGLRDAEWVWRAQRSEQVSRSKCELLDGASRKRNHILTPKKPGEVNHLLLGRTFNGYSIFIKIALPLSSQRGFKRPVKTELNQPAHGRDSWLVAHVLRAGHVRPESHCAEPRLRCGPESEAI